MANEFITRKGFRSLDDSQVSGSLFVSGTIEATQTAVLEGLENANADTDKFLVASADGTVKFRTGTEVLSDIGAGGASNLSGAPSEITYFNTNNEVTSSRRFYLVNTGSGAPNEDAQAVIIQGQLQVINDPTRNVGGSSPMQIIVGSGSSGDINNPQFDSFIALEQESAVTVGLRANGDAPTAAQIKMRTDINDAYSIGRLTHPYNQANTLRIKPMTFMEGGMTITGSLTVSGSNTFRNIGPAYFTEGNVGIGTASPVSNYQLHVKGTGRPALFDSTNAASIVKLTNSTTGNGTYNGLDFVVNSTSNNNINSYGMPLTFGTSTTNGTNVTERMRITKVGNVGIGTQSPSDKLTVVGNIVTSGSNGNIFQIGVKGSSPTEIVGGMRIEKVANYGSYLKIHAGRNWGGWHSVYGIQMQAVDDIVGYPSQSQHIRFNAKDVGPYNDAVLYVDSGSGGSRPSLHTAHGAAFAIESGSVGIGTATPASTLEVKAPATNSGTEVKITNKYGESPKALSFDNVNSAGTHFTIGQVAGYGRPSTPGGPYMQFKVHDGTTLNEVIRISGSGDVGIGTTTPSDKLDVHGTIAVNSIAFISQSAQTAYIGDIDGADEVGFLDINTAGASTRLFLDDGGNVGINTDSPSHTLDIVLDSSSDRLNITRGGAQKAYITGDGAGIFYAQLVSYGNSLSGGGGIFTYRGGTATQTIGHRFQHVAGGPFSATSGDQTMLKIEPIISQSGTAGYTGIKLDVTETNIGSGTNNLLDLQVDGVTKYAVDREGDVTIGGDLTVDGIVTAREFHTDFVSASIVYQSGSTKFGDTADDIHEFTGSLKLSGSIVTTGIESNAVIGSAELGSWPANNAYAYFGHKSLNHGSSANYAILHQNNGTLYINSSGGESIRFRHNNNENMLLSSQGNLGIGTSNPQTKLDVAGTAPVIRLTDTRNMNVGDWDDVSLGKLQFHTSDTTSPGARTLAEIEAYSGIGAASGPEAELRFKTSTISDSSAQTRMVIDAEGRVGIGTTNPTQTLQLGDINATSNPVLQLQGYDNATSSSKYGKLIVDTAGNFNVIAQDSYLVLSSANYIQSNQTHVMLQGILQSNNKGYSMQNTQGSFKKVLNLTTGNLVTIGGVSSGWTTGGDVAIFSAGTERMRIDTAGNVGIGKTNPSTKLDINGAFRASAASTISTSGGATGLTINDSSNAILDLTGNSNTYRLLVLGANNRFEIRDGSDTRMSITSNGNVGIGTTSPNHKLDIYADSNMPLRIHRPSSSLDTTEPVGIGFSHRGDTNTSTTDTRAGIFSSYNGDLFLSVDAGGRVDDNPIADAALFIEGTNKYVGIGTTSPSHPLQVAGTAASGVVANLSNSNFNYSILRLTNSSGNAEISSVNNDLYTGNDFGIGTTSPDGRLDVRGGKVFLSPAGNGSSGTNANALIIRNLNDTAYTADAINAYNNHTSYDIDTKAVFTVAARAYGAGSIYTFSGENPSEPASTQRYVQLNSGNNGPINKWVFYQWDGSGNTAADLKRPDTLWSIERYVGQAGDQVLQLSGSGQLQLSKYGSGNLTGTPAYRLSIDSSGNLIEESLGAGAVDGLGAANYLTRWQDTDTLTTSSLYESGGNIGIGNTNPGKKFDVSGTGRFGGELFMYSFDNFGSSSRMRDNLRLYFGTSRVFNLHYDSSGDDLRIGSGSAAIMTFDGEKRVGIGTTSPLSWTKLHVDGHIYTPSAITSDSYLRVRGASQQDAVIIKGNGTSYFNGGNVGIGTTSPSASLQVEGSADVVNIIGSGSTSNTSIFAVDGNNGRLFEVSDDLSDSLFSVNTIAGLPVLEVFADNRVVAGAYNQNDFVISGSRVGIGTDAPTDKLHIHDNTSGDTPRIHFTNSGTGTGGSDGAYVGLGNGDDLVLLNYESGGHTDFYTAGNNRMRIENTGNVGIGTTSPSEKLDVRNGTLTVRDDSNVNYVEIDRFAGITLKGNGTAHKTIQTPNTDALAFGTNNTERMRIDSSGRVLIGRTASVSNANGDDLQIGNTVGTHGLTILSQNNSVGIIYFGDNDNNDAGNINYDHSANQLRFTTNRTQKMVITDAGRVGIGTTSPDEKLHVEGAMLLDVYNTTGNETGIFFREGFTTSNKYNLSILAYDHNGAGTSPDGISINGYDGVSISTGANTRNERMRIDGAGRFLLNRTSPTNLPHTLQYAQAEIEYDGYGGLYIHGNNTGVLGATSSSYGLVVSASNHTVTNGGASYGAYIEARSTTFSNTKNYGVYAKSVRRGRAGQQPAIALMGHSTHTPITNNIDMTSDLVGVWSKVDFKDDSIPVTSSAEMYNFYGETVIPANKIIDDYYGLYLKAPTVNGTITNNRYGIYQAGSDEDNYFAGYVSINSSNASNAPLHVGNANRGSWNDGIVIDDPTGWAATIYKRSNSPIMFTGLRSGTNNFIWMSPIYSNSGTTITAPRADAILEANSANDSLEIYVPTAFGNKVLIGTATSMHSSADLQILGASGNYARIMMKDRDGTNQVAFIDESAGTLDLVSQNGTEHGRINLKTYDGTNSLNRLSIEPSGNVGIGTSNPGEKLQVEGTVKAHNFVAANEAGIYTFTDTVNSNSSEDIFRISNQHGAQAFRVTFVSSTSGYSVAKTYEVVHAYGKDPIYFKVVDTGPYEGHDFEAVFTDDVSSTGVKCTITNNSASSNADIATTVFLGGSPTDITVTAL